MKFKAAIYNQEGENYLHYNDTALYYRNLQATFNLINNGSDEEFLRFAYVTLCASTLEASLNHIIFTHYIDLFGPVDFKKYTDSLINIGFANKLHTIPTIVTKSEYYFDENSSTIKSLKELISLRNKILHKKPSLQRTDYDLHTLALGMELEIKDQNYMRRVTKNKCVNFNAAILAFRDEFMNPFLDNEGLKESDLIRRR